MDASELFTQVIEQALADKQAMMQGYDQLIYAAERGRAEHARLMLEQQRNNLDLKSEEEFAAALGVSVDTLRRHRQELPLDHVRACNTSIMYTAEQRAAACAALTRPRKRT